MTTTVRILVEGNKACQVKVRDTTDHGTQVSVVMPGQFTTKLIHGNQVIEVREVGDFLS